MNWRTLTWPVFLRKPFSKFLLIFSLCSFSLFGVIWACSFWEDETYSVFTPEYFVDNKYSPFFYAPDQWYYGIGYAESSNTQFNKIIIKEWDGYLDKKVDTAALSYLLLKASDEGIDSVKRYYDGELNQLPANYPDSTKRKYTGKKINRFINYLKLARACESYTIGEEYYVWDTIKRKHADIKIEPTLQKAFNNAPDDFIKERLWFQMVRYYYFDSDTTQINKAGEVFEKYQKKFPKNLIWYRALGYVAGTCYKEQDYARANYLYSLCFNYARELQIPSFWSFHPQNESDWKATLALAKTNEEKITLWQMLGVQYDEGRAIKEIVKIDPKTEKLDLLLSRVINIRESARSDFRENGNDTLYNRVTNRTLIERIAQANNTAKPYFWNLAAGYLNFLDTNYVAAAKYYAAAKKQIPAGNTQVVAQSKVLDILLMVAQLKKIDTATEQKLIEPLNWLADLGKKNSPLEDLRFSYALDDCKRKIGHLYNEQEQFLKAVCFVDTLGRTVYGDSTATEHLIQLLNKPNKTPFEVTMLRFYRHKVGDLYYHQALRLVFAGETKQAIAYLQKKTEKDFELYGNPFNDRITDCHDCDHAAPQKQKFTPLTFVQTLDKIQDEIKQGRSVYRNAYLAANAYYNISYYGNGRVLFESDMLPGVSSNGFEESGLDTCYTSMAQAKQYYSLARRNAATAEQKARCTFMLAKCVQNEGYNNYAGADEEYTGYFAELKNAYGKTNYYKEVLKECDYFRDYIFPPKKSSAK